MTIVRTQVEFDHDSGLARDRIVNTYHHITATSPPSTSELNAIRDRLVAGYTAIQAPGTAALTTYFGTTLNGTWRLKHYDVDAPDDSPPLRVDTPTAFGFTAANNLPSECALVLSYDSYPWSANIPMGSQRGRVYIGPFNTNTVGSAGRPDQAVINAIVGLGGLLMAESGGVEWRVFSRKRAALLGSAQAHTQVRRVRCDNEWDIQRRRGMRPTAYTQLLNA